MEQKRRCMNERYETYISNRVKAVCKNKCNSGKRAKTAKQTLSKDHIKYI
jgi:hypothetical protein